MAFNKQISIFWPRGVRIYVYDENMVLIDESRDRRYDLHDNLFQTWPEDKRVVFLGFRIRSKNWPCWNEDALNWIERRITWDFKFDGDLVKISRQTKSKRGPCKTEFIWKVRLSWYWIDYEENIMQTVIQILCKGGKSLREVIANDGKLEEHNLYLARFRQQGRSPGWAKVRSKTGAAGAINFVWSASSRTLTCRVVTKFGNRPYQVVGDFIAYLLARHSRRMITVVISQSK